MPYLETSAPQAGDVLTGLGAIAELLSLSLQREITLYVGLIPVRKLFLIHRRIVAGIRSEGRLFMLDACDRLAVQRSTGFEKL